MIQCGKDRLSLPSNAIAKTYRVQHGISKLAEVRVVNSCTKQDHLSDTEHVPLLKFLTGFQEMLFNL